VNGQIGVVAALHAVVENKLDGKTSFSSQLALVNLVPSGMKLVPVTLILATSPVMCLAGPIGVLVVPNVGVELNPDSEKSHKVRLVAASLAQFWTRFSPVTHSRVIHLAKCLIGLTGRNATKTVAAVFSLDGEKSCHSRLATETLAQF